MQQPQQQMTYSNHASQNSNGGGSFRGFGDANGHQRQVSTQALPQTPQIYTVSAESGKK